MVMTVVPAEVLALLQQQGGMVRRRDLQAAGLLRRALERAVSAGALRLLHGGVVSARVDVPADEQARAAVVGLDGTASHTTAARAWGIELVEPAPGPEVTVCRDRSRARWPGTGVHRHDLGSQDVVLSDGVRVTSPLRTVLDLCRTLPVHQAVAAADSALRQGLVRVEELVRAADELPAGRGRARVREAVGLVDPRSGSVLESVFRVLLALAGVPAPETQHAVRDARGRLLGRVDFAWLEERLVVETDGFTFHADRASYRADRRRTNALVLAGLRVLRFSWEDVLHDPEHVVAVVREALAAAV